MMWVWDVEREIMIEVTPAEAAAGVQRYARSLGAGSAACGVWERRAVAMARTCDDCGAAPGEECAWSCSSNFDPCGVCRRPVLEGERVEEYAGLTTHYGCVPR